MPRPGRKACSARPAPTAPPLPAAIARPGQGEGKGKGKNKKKAFIGRLSSMAAVPLGCGHLPGERPGAGEKPSQRCGRRRSAAAFRLSAARDGFESAILGGNGRREDARDSLFPQKGRGAAAAQNGDGSALLTAALRALRCSRCFTFQEASGG